MRPGYLADYELEGIVAFREDPIAAAIRADQTAARHVMDRAHDYQTALSQGNAANIAATKAALRQAWETDVRRRGGKPEDFIPDYYNADPVIIQHTFLGGSKIASSTVLGSLIAGAALGAGVYKYATSVNTADKPLLKIAESLGLIANAAVFGITAVGAMAIGGSIKDVFIK